MKNGLKVGLVAVFLFVLPGLSWAGTRDDLLSLSQGLSQAWTGNNFMLSGNGSQSTELNPANLGFMLFREYSLAYATLFEGGSYGRVFMAFPTVSAGAFGVGLYRLDNASLGDSFRDPEILFKLSYGRAPFPDFLPHTSFGFGLNLLHRSGPSENAPLSTLDFGLRYEHSFYSTRKPWNLGVVLYNIPVQSGGEMANLPSPVVKAGFGWPIAESKFSLVGDAAFLRTTDMRLGLEYELFPNFALSLGRGNQSLSAGTRWGWGSFHLKYSAESHSRGLLHQAGLTYSFGNDIRHARESLVEQLYRESKVRVEEGKYEDAFQGLSQAKRQTSLPAEQEKLFQGLRVLVEAGVPSIEGSEELHQLLRQGIRQYLAGNPEVAREVFQAASNKNPEHRMPRRLLALLRPSGQKPGSSPAPFSAASGFTDVDPIKLKLFKSEQYFHQEDYDLVLKECHEILEINPNEVMAYVRMGSALYALGIKDKARKAWERAWRLNPGHPDVKKTIEFMRQEGFLKGQEGLSVRERPSRPRYRVRIGNKKRTEPRVASETSSVNNQAGLFFLQ
ncbi:MAG: hypothetical protein HY399_06390 [Elusimicrobia bacterium]|nr:hypothetical protein [Elusimicrobiota bacterium]